MRIATTILIVLTFLIGVVLADSGEISNPQDVTIEITATGAMVLQLGVSPKANIGGALTRDNWKYTTTEKTMIANWLYACSQQKAVRLNFDASGITSLVIINW